MRSFEQVWTNGASKAPRHELALCIEKENTPCLYLHNLSPPAGECRR
jgi:hypothetical protein